MLRIMGTQPTTTSPVLPRDTATSLRSSWLSWTIAFALCLSAALVGIEAWQMWHVREANLRSAKIVTASLAESLSQQIDTTLKTADTVVSSLVQRVEIEGVTPETLQRLYGLMTSLAAALPAIHEMGLTDKDGNAIVKSLVPHPVGMNYRERDYFRFLSTHDTHDAFIGVPVKSKIDGSINITVSRRVNAPDGSFAGIVVTSVSMDFFRKLFELVQGKSGGFISLVADNGVPLARSPDSFGDGEFDALAASPTSALEYLSPRDGVYRVGSYNHLSRYPMIAMVAEDSAAILREWHGQLRAHGAIVVGMLLVIGVLGYKVDQANRATRMQALRDGLTELANRRCFDLTIEREFRRAARSGLSLSLIMVDIDLFKSFNDQYGHPAGDACLRAISSTVQGVLRRPGDMAARYGGEEIAILLPETDAAGAVQIVADMLAAVRAQAFRHEASPHGIVTLSAGVASWNPRQRTATWPWLVEVADAALYAAKAHGRDTFTVHPTAVALVTASAMEREKAA
jgi:diguanylate cyclase (GGDEF)-like protein